MNCLPPNKKGRLFCSAPDVAHAFAKPARKNGGVGSRLMGGVARLVFRHYVAMVFDMPARTVEQTTMARHTSPNRHRIEDAFPVRIKIRVPPRGLGNRLSDIHVWLRDNVPEGDNAQLSCKSIGQQATAFYFRDLDTAQAFLRAFPDIDLADGVGGRTVAANKAAARGKPEH